MERKKREEGGEVRVKDREAKESVELVIGKER